MLMSSFDDRVDNRFPTPDETIRAEHAADTRDDSAPSGDDLFFEFVDDQGNSLRFDRFHYEFALKPGINVDDANWLACRIALEVRVDRSRGSRPFRQAVDAFLQVHELGALSKSLAALLTGSTAEDSFSPLEPYIDLQFTKEAERVDVIARLDLSPALGPVIEFCYWCPLNTIAALISQIESVREALPERNPKRG
jgi:hypothetical protein